MKTSVLSLIAFASLVIANTAHAGIAPISWQNWNIAVTDFQLTETVDMENMFEKNPVAEEGNTFVEVTIKVKNNGTKSDSFHPSHLVKLSVHGAAIDAADVLTDRLSDQIEPFTSQLRKFYFEIPREFEGESAELQFAEGQLFSQGTSYAVPVTLPKQANTVFVPAPTPTPARNAEEERTSSDVNTNHDRNAQPTPQLKATGLSASQLLENLTQAFDHYDWETVTSYIADGQVSYYGHYNVTNEFVRRDIMNDSQTYRSSHTTIDWSTLRTRTVGGLTYASVQEWTSVYERSGRYHHAHAVWTVGFDPQDSKVYLLDFKVIR
jgi:hypothetical protein